MLLFQNLCFGGLPLGSWTLLAYSWTAPKTVDRSCPHDEARSKASGLTPPRWLCPLGKTLR
ncbi:hypothetical protein CWC46_06660 [Prodigiosinella confusarubida]|uniref:Uncharacterized protein n=1 Tax=Serratia sp. (strain ATCC 39006) TaxID=104623 RepID=A0A2I5T4P6_SERS3|nr:hypothetical protein CWC46_06660 [Serratia sp. ATCC 39006]AUH03844.1 hypothetical protein Ser39006_006665 [Serratia sp. ATCC 39006]